MALHLETQNVTYYLDENQEFYKKFRAFLDFPDEWFAPWNKRKDEHITKIVLNYEDEKIVEKFLEEYSDKLQCVKPFVGRGILDVTSKGVTKGEAIRRLLSYFDIDVRDSYAFGDSDNDVEMLRAVGTGIVMEHHSKAAGEAATMVTGAVKDEGITQALEKLGLI
jgi:HAD superfamily hydrolase (TIGR01484 family)